ncbi:MAG: hypothetical protein ACRDKH_00140 [Solirubrobacterales bacterium]
MGREAWTEERLDDLAEAMHTGFAELKQEMRAGFARVDQQFARVDQRFTSTDGDIHSGFARVDQDMRGLRAEINRIWLLIMSFGGGIIVALVGVIAALLARGA